MKFRHSLQILIDNFSVTYKQLLYTLVIAAITFALSIAILYPLWQMFTGLPEFRSLVDGVKNFLNHLIEGNTEELVNIREMVESALDSISALINSHTSVIALAIAGLILS